MIFERKCTHKNAITKNCNYCPDCGKKIVHKWVTIKCRMCGHYRKPLYNMFEKIKPAKKYCFHCGSDKWNYQYYYESTIPDRMKLISLKQVLEEEQVINRFKPGVNRTRVWINK